MGTPFDGKPAHIACICCNGELRGSARAKKIASGADILIAANGGANHIAEMGLKPHVIIGDMDSLADDLWPADRDIRRITFQKDKDRSDTELAIEWAFNEGATHLLLISAWGGRIDHTLANSALLLRYPGRITLWDNGYTAVALSDGQRVELNAHPQAITSIIPFTEGSRITTRGLKFTLNDQTLDYATHGLSNVVVDKASSVYVNAGLIILCVEGENTCLVC